MSLDYEQMLAALQGFVGAEVTVVIAVRLGGRTRPVALLGGQLRSADSTELRDDVRWEALSESAGMPGGEYVFFRVGASGSFILRRDDFKLGERRDDGTLEWHTGKATFTVGPPLTPEEIAERNRRFLR